MSSSHIGDDELSAECPRCPDRGQCCGTPKGQQQRIQSPKRGNLAPAAASLDPSHASTHATAYEPLRHARCALTHYTLLATRASGSLGPRRAADPHPHKKCFAPRMLDLGSLKRSKLLSCSKRKELLFRIYEGIPTTTSLARPCVKVTFDATFSSSTPSPPK